MYLLLWSKIGVGYFLVTKNGHSVGLWCINFDEGLNGTSCLSVSFVLIQKVRKDQGLELCNHFSRQDICILMVLYL